MKNKINKEDAEKIVKECYNIADFCRKVGWVPRGDNYKTFHKYVKEYNLDITHFTTKKTSFSNKVNENKELTVEEYLNNNMVVRGSTLLKKMIKEEIKEHKCEKCKNTEWQNNPIPLQIHHIDGNHFNNNLDNIQFLCPNCHSLTNSFAGKKNKKKYFCKKCGKQITKYSKSGLCQDCSHEAQRKYEKPTKEELVLLFIEFKNFYNVAKHFKCSDQIIKKWCKSYDLPVHAKEMKNYIKGKTS